MLELKQGLSSTMPSMPPKRRRDDVMDATAEKNDNNDDNNDDDEGIATRLTTPSQQFEVDERLVLLEKSGALSQVMGSQSLLSQEIQDHFESALLLQDSSGSSSMAVLAVSSQLSFLMDAAQALEDQEATREVPVEWYPAEVTSDIITRMTHQSTRHSTTITTESTNNTPQTTTLMTTNTKTTTSSNSFKKAFTPQKKRKFEREQEQKQSQNMAQQAAELAAQVIDSPQVAKQLLLTMALVRINPRSAPTTWPQRGSDIPEGFFWGTFPPLETVLRQHMREYYDLSTKMCQSKDQQHFNNALVIKIRAEATNYGWIFGPRFTDKILRDRIRCFFKTHIQNSKKRLRTMVKNPTKKANAKALVKHLDLIQTYSEMEPGSEPVDDFLGDAKKLPAPRKNEMYDVVDQEAVNSVMALGLLSAQQTVGV